MKLIYVNVIILLSVIFLFSGCCEKCKQPEPCSVSHVVDIPEKPLGKKYELLQTSEGYFITNRDAIILKYNWLEYKNYSDSLLRELNSTKQAIDVYNLPESNK